MASLESDSAFEKTPHNERRSTSHSEHYLLKQTTENIHRRLLAHSENVIEDRKGNPRTFTGADLIRFGGSVLCVVGLSVVAQLAGCARGL